MTNTDYHILLTQTPNYFGVFFISQWVEKACTTIKGKRLIMKEVLSREKTNFVDDKVVKTKKFDFTQNEKQEAEDLKNLLIYQIKRYVTKLYKNHLTNLEDIRQEHLACLHKVGGLVDEDFIKMIHFFDSQKAGYLRKKTLDSGNETIRDVENLLENFEFKLKK
ncbi:hypothetical protein CMI37_14850 [Candidatus Pacearchaeota archaeon]|nr:hypothetical protein [Candidatus Pacearchaeota archaeon]